MLHSILSTTVCIALGASIGISLRHEDYEAAIAAAIAAIGFLAYLFLGF